MSDVTSSLSLVSYQLTAERFPVGQSTTRDIDKEEVACAKNALSSSWSEAEVIAPTDNNDERPLDDRCPTRPPSQRAGDDARLTAVHRLALMIQRFAAHNQRDLPVTSPSSHLYQATPSHLPMTSSGDVTSSRDCDRVCPYIGKSLSVDWSQSPEIDELSLASCPIKL